MSSGRIIMHVDFNSYFASVEQQANPFLRGKAIAVGGKPGKRSVVATSSQEARKCGVRTAMSSFEAVQICPELEMIDGDSRKYSEITDRFLNIFRRHATTVEQYSIDEAFLDITLDAKDWMGATIIALRIREDIENELGPAITASIGVGPNKLVAKIASDSDKPNGVTLVQPDELFEFLDQCELSDIPGIGKSTLVRLSEIGISKISQLRSSSLAALEHSFKQHGAFLYSASRGIDESVVSDIEESPKSIGHSYTLPVDTSSQPIIRATLLTLSHRVAWRLRKQGLVAGGYSAVVRFGSLQYSRSIGQFDSATDSGLDIFNAAWMKIAPLLTDNDIRLVGVTAREIVSKYEQLSVNKKERKLRKILPSLDKIQTRFGAGSWRSASELSAIKLHERTSGFFFDHI